MEIFSTLATTSTLLTPNRRLSAYYLKEYEKYQLASGKNHWQTLDILPITSWLERSWKEYSSKEITETFILLNANQELILWEKIIAYSKDSQHLLQISATAELAKQAWGTLKQWNVSLDHPLLKTTEDSNTFLAWALEFEATCKKQRWIDQNNLANIIEEKILNNNIKIPEQITLIGFTEISPQYKKILSAYEKMGTSIQFYNQQTKNNTIYRTSVTDKETEIRTLARWAKKILDNSRLTDPKPPMIACVVPNLEDHRATVNRIFSEVFTEAGYYTSNPITLPYNISAGRNLASFPVIHIAFLLLELHLNKLSIETLSTILRTPFLGEAEKEMMRRAEFDNQLRQDNISSITFEKLLKKNNLPELFAKRLTLYHDKINSLTEKNTIANWVNHFIEILTALGWPGERSVNSEEYQVIQRWVELLSEYSTYEYILKPLNYKEALSYLKRLTAKTVFQAQSPETPIQILGMLEAAEIPFDYLWAMGMDDNAWPPSPKPNPFIPQFLQKTLQMPHATADRELQFCEKMTSQLKNSANTVIFSHALHRDDSELRSSSLIENLPEIAAEQLLLSDNIHTANIIFDKKDIQLFHDETVPALKEEDIIYGGAKIFELQATCPFKAFAEIRLYARAVDESVPGLRALDRGNIVHKALELIWIHLKDSATLHQQTSEELDLLIQASIKKAIHLITGEQTENLNFLTLELQRLQKIIWNWLQFEKSRPPFTVKAQEQKYKITIANILINLRIDRIDTINDNDIFIIDYKTGKNNHIQDWFGHRPDAPQLPIYCLIDPDNTIGIAFGIIHPEKMELKGVSKSDLNLRDISPINETKISDTPVWKEQLEHWRQTLEKLGHDFYHGKAEIDPKYGQQTCEHCKLKPFCRIYEKEND